jgi:hypothetical protein
VSFAATIKPHPENQLSVSDFIHFRGSVMIGGPFVVSSMYIRVLPSKIWGIQSTNSCDKEINDCSATVLV